MVSYDLLEVFLVRLFGSVTTSIDQAKSRKSRHTKYDGAV